MKVALVYDRVSKWGGAERVLLALHEIFPNAPLYTSLYDANKANWAQIFPKVIPSWLNTIPYLRNKHELLGIIMPFVFESHNFSNYDLVVSVTSEAAKGIRCTPKTRHICYCLTPTRYLWSGYDEYFKSLPLKIAAKPFISYLRAWDRIAANRPDKLLSISTEVKNRIKKYYGLDSIVVYPPVEVDKFRLSNQNFGTKHKLPITNYNNHQQNSYYLLVSRLVPYKKTDLAIQAFNKLGLPLVIIGTGSEEKKLKRMANNNVKFIKHLTDDKLADYYQNAVGFIMPQEEDFGIVAVEAQAAGTPVIAFKKGGALDTIENNRTGLFFTEQNVESLISAVKKFNKIIFKREDLVRNAKRFSKENFKSNFLKLLK